MTEISHTSGGHPYSSRNKQHIHENTCMLEKKKTRIQSGATKENSIKVPSKNILLLGLAIQNDLARSQVQLYSLYSNGKGTNSSEKKDPFCLFFIHSLFTIAPVILMKSAKSIPKPLFYT